MAIIKTVYLVHYETDDLPVHQWYNTTEEAQASTTEAKKLYIDAKNRGRPIPQEIIDSFDKYSILTYELKID
jgi:hypothetical protein